MGKQSRPPGILIVCDDGEEQRKIKYRLCAILMLSVVTAYGQNTPVPASEQERWNAVLTDPKSTFFNREANGFLMRMVPALTPGRASDAGMGQGRSALWLASTGWDVTGFDPAKRAVAYAAEAARKRGLRMTTEVSTFDRFDWGKDRGDLIVLTYVAVRTNVGRVKEALAPGGVVIVEGTHRDTLKAVPVRISEEVLFADNELIHLFDGLRVLQYEDVPAASDFGPQGQRDKARTVRLMAQKPR
jgi:SAM-dependent methyltransferase